MSTARVSYVKFQAFSYKPETVLLASNPSGALKTDYYVVPGQRPIVQIIRLGIDERGLLTTAA